jgi:hypothetical protein
MKVAAGLKTHSGWACLVIVGSEDRSRAILERSRLELVEPGRIWTKAPYHAAEGRKPTVAKRIVERGKRAAHKVARVEIERLAERLRQAHHELVGCGVIVGAPMPDWSVDDILAVHVRMHQAEGAMFPRALADALADLALPLVLVPKKDAEAQGTSNRIATLGKGLGPPWGQDQKQAAAAATIVLDQAAQRK